ncbi:hypothetical protein SLS63_010203 [Diaporthe eres]|uniref:F-box domain-containing protein n=1 Tax=Diaporthe eres TaxID=83184 RepID=A0ABR1NXK1_DIAER
MSHQDLDTEELLSLLSDPYQAPFLARTMIPMCDPPKPMGAWQPQGDASPLGLLAILPVELLHELLKKLDLQSITRFSRVSIQARIAVQSLPGYRDLMSHALHALEALSQTRMICHHTASQLIAAFRNEQCTICSAFGPYLHLMTCERICWQCLERNRTLRVIPRETASEAFALSDEQVRQLPTIFTIPGRYGGTQTPNRYRYNLVSVRAAIELAISVHGSLESVSEAFRGRTHTGIRAYEERDLQAALDVVASGKYDALFTQPEDPIAFMA